MHDDRSSRECIFCGQAARSRQHIWDAWLQKALPSLATMRLHHARASSTGSEQQYSNLPFRATVRAVCRTCNGGWMSDIENGARRMASGMVHGEARDLSPRDQEALATWAVLKAMVFEHAHDGDYVLIPPEHYRQMYERRGLPDATQVWIARVDPDATSTGTPVFSLIDSRGLIDPGSPVPDEAPDAYTTTLSINQLVLAVFGSRLPGAPRLVHGADVAPAIRQIWPVQRENMAWPFEPTLTVRGLERLASGRVTTTQLIGVVERPPRLA